MAHAHVPAPARIEPETPADALEAEALVMAAFGPGRFAKTAERLRERAGLAAGFVARDGGRLIGVVRLWKITVGGAPAPSPALFLGPIAVDAAARRGGLGAELTAACLAYAREQAVAGVLLVGDPPYFARFGFRPAPGARLPGPVDPRRVMWLGVASEGAEGPVAPAA